MDSANGKRLVSSGAGRGAGRRQPGGAETPECGAALRASLARERGLDSSWTLQEPRAQRTEPRFPTQEGCRRAPLQTGIGVQFSPGTPPAADRGWIALPPLGLRTCCPLTILQAAPGPLRGPHSPRRSRPQHSARFAHCTQLGHCTRLHLLASEHPALPASSLSAAV